MDKNVIIAIVAVLAFIAGGAAVWIVMSNTSQSPANVQEQEDVGENGALDPEPGTVFRIIEYTNDGFSPSSLTIRRGTLVLFENGSSVSMWVASDPHPVHTDLPEFDREAGVDNGGSSEFTFMTKGTWGYHNHLMPNHTGTIIVE